MAACKCVCWHLPADLRMVAIRRPRRHCVWDAYELPYEGTGTLTASVHMPPAEARHSMRVNGNGSAIPHAGASHVWAFA